MADVKWKDGYVCKRCGGLKYCKGVKLHSRRCIKCRYDESPTAGTMFDKCKFSLQYPINEMVCVDEFFVGGEEEGVIGRQRGKKRLVIVAIEIVKKEDGSNGMGRAYARVIPNASSKSFKLFFDDHISKDTKVITDKWQGYVPLKQYYPNLEQVKSDKGKGMPELHNHIMNLKGWLRGRHHHCSEEHLQGYLDEYHYRCNRRTKYGGYIR